MQHRARLCAAVAATAALLTPAAAAAPPEAGVLAPGTSLGGVRLGMTKADVRRTWGSSYGRCRDCDRWYGQEDDELGPCMYKHARADAKHLTPGGMACDEPEELERRRLEWSRRRTSA